MNRFNQYLATICLLLVINSISYSQYQGDHEITIGLGTISTNKMVQDVSSGFSTLMTFGTSTYEISSSGAINIGYKYAATKRFKIGVVIAHEKIQKTYSSIFSRSSGDRSTSRYVTAAVESDVRYIVKPAFQMYSGLGIGYTMIDSGNYDGENYVNFHFNAIGLRIGKTVALRMELGVGYKGVFNAGLSIQI